jgi:hypothetical protein
MDKTLAYRRDVDQREACRRAQIEHRLKHRLEQPRTLLSAPRWRRSTPLATATEPPCCRKTAVVVA